ncbi:MAG: RSP_2648 family PIN domain-containing protein [Qingshengfaniella sp.]
MRAVLDACVLYPTLLRAVLLGAARRGLFTPLWSDRILEEWRRAVIRNHPVQTDEAGAEIALVTAAFPGAGVAVSGATLARLSLPDAADCHVLAAAIDGGATALVTLNLRDFPGRTLARDGVTPRSPDSLMLELHGEAPGAVADAVAEALAHLRTLSGNEAGDRALLKRAGLPRLGKALGRG